MLLWFVPQLAAAQAMKSLQEPINQVIAVLKESGNPKAGSTGEYEKIRSIIDSIFDFEAISKRAVGPNWKRFTPEEQSAFTTVFAELLSRSYIERIKGNFTNEQVVYLGENMPSPDKAQVKTEITRKGGDIPVDYSMQLTNESWRIYDVVIEGMSMVKNYRSQFNDVLMRESPAQLIARLKQKVDEQRK